MTLKGTCGCQNRSSWRRTGAATIGLAAVAIATGCIPGFSELLGMKPPEAPTTPAPAPTIRFREPHELSLPDGSYLDLRPIRVKSEGRLSAVHLVAELRFPEEGVTFAWSLSGGKLSSKEGVEVVYDGASLIAQTCVDVEVRLQATNLAGQVATQSTSLVIKPDGAVSAGNLPPEIKRVRPCSTCPEGVLEITADASDPEGDPLTYEWFALRGSTEGGGSSTAWNPGPLVPTSDTIVLIVRDSCGAADRSSLSFNIDKATGKLDIAPVTVALPTVSGPLGDEVFSLPPGVFVDSVAILPPTDNGLAVNMPDSEGAEPGFQTSLQLRARCTLSDGATNSLVAWSSSDQALATVDWNGIVRATPGSLGGIVTIMAKSIQDPRQAATTSVEVATKGQLGVEIR